MTKVKVLSTEGCKHCKKAHKLLQKIKEDMEDLEIEKVDVTENPEVLKDYPIMSTPGIVIDGELKFEGGVTEKKLREKLEG